MGNEIRREEAANSKKQRKKQAEHTNGHGWTRRTALKAGVAAGAVTVLTSRKGFATDFLGAQAAATTAAATPPPEPIPCSPNPTHSPETTPFVQALPIPPVAIPQFTLSPAPTLSANTAHGEAARADHQRWNQFLPHVYYDIHLQPALHQFHPDIPPTYIWGYNGIYPGPSILNLYNIPILVRFHNDLPATHNDAVNFGDNNHTTHLHNAHTASESDGFAGDFWPPGLFKDHHYPNILAGFDTFPATRGDIRERLSTLWYHDHRHSFTATNNYRGLNGMYFLYDFIDTPFEGFSSLSSSSSSFATTSSSPTRPSWENNLIQTLNNATKGTKTSLATADGGSTSGGAATASQFDTNTKSSFAPLFLPGPYGVYDIPLNFTDKKFCPDGQMFATVPDAVPAGDKFCVNGAIQPFFQVKRRKYRFRMLNSGPARIWTFSLFDNGGGAQPMTVICTDGNLVQQPFPLTSLQIHVSQRFDVVIDFSNTNIGDHWYLTNNAPQFTQNAPEPNPAPGVDINTVVMRFDIVGDAADNSQVPAHLIDYPDLNLNEVVTTRIWNFDLFGGQFHVNDLIFDSDRSDAIAKQGTAETWIIRNRLPAAGWVHPVHIHLEEGRILSRNGVPPAPNTLDSGRRDVYPLNGGDEVHIFLRFREWFNRYMIHCHNLGHEDNFMLVRWDVGTATSLVTSPFKDPAGTIPNTPGAGPGDPADPDHGAQPNPNPPILTKDDRRLRKGRKTNTEGELA
jgi:FtsP/CotA-like multicopper oxidase with cupredoxin domain